MTISANNTPLKSNIKKILSIAIAATLLTGCGTNASDNRFAKEPTQTTQSVSYKALRMDKDLMEIDTTKTKASLLELSQKYGESFNIYLLRGIEVAVADREGKIDYDTTAQILNKGIFANKGYVEIYKDIDSVFANGLDKESDEISQGMTRFKQFFPEANVPSQFISMFSAFGPGLAIGDKDEIFVSLEYYLGSNYKNYAHVSGIYDYITPNLRRERIACDVMQNWISNQLPENINGKQRLLEAIVYQGMLLYITEACMPNTPPSDIIGFTKEQWEWCEDNEADMWKFIKNSGVSKNKKFLYDTDHLTISKFTTPAPTTQFFPVPGSPGRAANWLGWKIVASYMSKNKEAKLPELVKMATQNDCQTLLEKSGYNPR